jgi:hypothetical protein
METPAAKIGQARTGWLARTLQDFRPQELYYRKPAGRISVMRTQAGRRHYWDYGPGLWGCCFGAPWRRRPSRREEIETLKDYIEELKEELQDAEERLKDLEK